MPLQEYFAELLEVVGEAQQKKKEKKKMKQTKQTATQLHMENSMSKRKKGERFAMR